MKRELKRQAECQANEINEMMLKKEKLQQKWLTLTFFAGTFTNWLYQLKTSKRKKINEQIKRMKAYLIQKNFKRRFSQKFDFRHRILALARNNLSLFDSLSLKPSKHDFFHSFQKCVKEIKTYQQVSQSFDSFHSRWSVIKARWRFFMQRNHRRANHLMLLWNKTASSLINKLTVKGKKKKKTHIVEKIANIPLHVKEKFIKDHMNNCKEKFLIEMRSGKKPNVLQFLIDEEKLAKVILQFIGPKPKMQKKLTIRKVE
jgi:hypothetical protein